MPPASHRTHYYTARTAHAPSVASSPIASLLYYRACLLPLTLPATTSLPASHCPQWDAQQDKEEDRKWLGKQHHCFASPCARRAYHLTLAGRAWRTPHPAHSPCLPALVPCLPDHHLDVVVRVATGRAWRDGRATTGLDKADRHGSRPFVSRHAFAFLRWTCSAVPPVPAHLSLSLAMRLCYSPHAVYLRLHYTRCTAAIRSIVASSRAAGWAYYQFWTD